MNPDFEKFGLNIEKSQVFLFASPCNVPFNFAIHTWFVVNEKGSISRWEVLGRDSEWRKKWEHLYQDFFPAFQGIEVFSFSKQYFWQGKLLNKFEDEIAIQIAKLIKDSPNTYPYTKKYRVSGPNSNTYVQWVLNQVSNISTKLPNRAIGRNYVKVSD